MTKDDCAELVLLPRFLRLRDAPRYLGMDRIRFCEDVRPYVTEIPIGKTGIAFDRLELDAFADHYVESNGRPASNKENLKWDVTKKCLQLKSRSRGRKAHRGSGNAVASGISTNECEVSQFEKALAQAISEKPN